MQFLFKLFSVIIWFFLYHSLITIIGLVFVRFDWSHKFGLRCLAMGFVKPSFIESKCRLDCTSCRCGNWTCSRYYK